MRIIGIDPGLTHTGWGIIDAHDNRLTHISHGVISTKTSMPMADRLVQIYDGLTEMMMLWQPGGAAVEETFVNKNGASTLKLGFARGVALLAPAKAGLDVAEYAAKQVKKSVVGTGGADKVQMQAMIKILLPGVEASTDAADALAVAICHAHHAASAQLVEKAIRA